MTHGRKPRRPRTISLDPVRLARNGATRLTAAEVDKIIVPMHAAAKALREGVGTEEDWCVLASSMNVAQAIERQGVVRGLVEHLRSCELALQSIERRANGTGTWKPTALYYLELDAIQAAVHLHEFQIKQLSYGEFRRAVLNAEAEIRSSGGRAITTQEVAA